VIALVGSFEPSLTGSELAKLRGVPPRGPLPELDEVAITAAHGLVRSAMRAGQLTSAHDIAEGGLAVALAECCLGGGLGATVELPDGLDPFAEAPGRAFVVSGSAEAIARLGESAVPVQILGAVGGSTLRLEGQLEIAVSGLEEAWRGGLAKFL
jgi:phosphoribosylformylglycinamidine synthase